MASVSALSTYVSIDHTGEAYNSLEVTVDLLTGIPEPSHSDPIKNAQFITDLCPSARQSNH